MPFCAPGRNRTDPQPVPPNTGICPKGEPRGASRRASTVTQPGPAEAGSGVAAGDPSGMGAAHRLPADHRQALKTKGHVTERPHLENPRP